MRRTYVRQKLIVIVFNFDHLFAGRSSAFNFFLFLILLFLFFLLLIILFILFVYCFSLLWGYFWFDLVLLFLLVPSYEVIFVYFCLFFCLFLVGSSTLCDSLTWEAWLPPICKLLELVFMSLSSLCLWSGSLFLLCCRHYVYCLPSQSLRQQCHQGFCEVFSPFLQILHSQVFLSECKISFLLTCLLIQSPESLWLLFLSLVMSFSYRKRPRMFF